MCDSRPFPDVGSLIERAQEIWQNLKSGDWLEAFGSHPKIGDRKAAPKQGAQSSAWSQSEQAQVHQASQTVLESLAEANQQYEQKFGYIYIVCASGISADEMLQICQNRLKNDSATEILQAAEEQRKITEIRLRKLTKS
jgi:OHCU decarboxylase